MIKGLVSIIILTYNRKELLRESLEYINISTYKNIEIIIIDNASIDGTADFLKNCNYNFIRLDKNIGVEGWNKGIESANGE